MTINQDNNGDAKEERVQLKYTKVTIGRKIVVDTGDRYRPQHLYVELGADIKMPEGLTGTEFTKAVEAAIAKVTNDVNRTLAAKVVEITVGDANNKFKKLVKQHNQQVASALQSAGLGDLADDEGENGCSLFASLTNG